MAFGFTYTLPTISGTHTDFPVVLKTADFPSAAVDGGASSLLNGGGDLRAYTDNTKTTRLPLDVVRLVTGGTPDCEVHVKVPSAATSSTIYLEADAIETAQPAVTDTFGRNAVWSDYEAVWHLGEASGDFVDSTGKGFDITPTSETSITRAVASPTGLGVSIGGGLSDTQMEFATGASVFSDATAAETLQATVSRGADTGGPNLIIDVGGSANGRALYYRSIPNTLHFGASVDSVDLQLTSTTTISESSAATMIHGRMDSGAMTLLINGASEDTGTLGSTGYTENVDTHNIGNEIDTAVTDAVGAATSWDGLLSEIRSRFSPVSDDWAATEYQNHFATSAWGTVGAWEDQAGGTNVNATTATLSITEQTATVNAERNIQAGVATLTLTEQSADVNLNRNVAAGFDTLTLATFTATVELSSAGTNVLANTVALSITEQAATINAATNVNANSASLSLTEQPAQIGLSTNVGAGVVALALTEQPANVQLNREVLTSAASLALNSLGATVNASTNISTNADVLTLSPLQATVALDGVPQIDGNSSKTVGLSRTLTLYFNGTDYFSI
jgi:hypothetical protein